jgi:hypothetical protein
MKRLLCGAMLLLAAIGSAQAQIVLRVAPPSDRVEVAPPPPPGHPGRWVWRPGHWLWRAGHYVWVAGDYVRAPRHGAGWVPGHWAARHGGWVWVEGHWR